MIDFQFWTAYPSEICVPRLDVQIQEVEDNSVGQIAERAIVDTQSLPSVDHLWMSSVASRKLTELSIHVV